MVTHLILCLFLGSMDPLLHACNELVPLEQLVPPEYNFSLGINEGLRDLFDFDFGKVAH